MLKEKRCKLKLLTYIIVQVLLVTLNMHSNKMNEKEFHLFNFIFIYLIKLPILNINNCYNKQE